MIAIILGEILNLLKEMGPSRKQSQLAIELFVRIMTRAGEAEQEQSQANFTLSILFRSQC